MPFGSGNDLGRLRETMVPVRPATLIHPARIALRKVGREGEPKLRWWEVTKVASLILRMDKRREVDRGEGGDTHAWLMLGTSDLGGMVLSFSLSESLSMLWGGVVI